MAGGRCPHSRGGARRLRRRSGGARDDNDALEPVVYSVLTVLKLLFTFTYDNFYATRIFGEAKGPPRGGG